MSNRGNGDRANGSEPLIRLRGVQKKYAGGGGVVALKGIDLDVQEGEFLVVTGKSGSGKTTLVNMITGLDEATSGEIWVAGTPVHKLGGEAAARWRGENVGIVFQTFELLPTLTVLQNVTLPMDLRKKYSVRERRERARYLLDQVGIAEHAGKPPSGVSGGQRQRVAIARALANDPPIIVADEPTGSLDSATAADVLHVLQDLIERGHTVVLVTHDRDIAERGTRTITLSDGEIVDSEKESR